MKIKITIIEIDFPDEQRQPAYQPVHPLVPLIEKLRKETETGRDSTHWTSPQEPTHYGAFLAQ